MDYKKILVAMVLAVGMTNCTINPSLAINDSSAPVLLNPSRVEGGATSTSQTPSQAQSSTKSAKTISTKIQYTRYKKVKKAVPKKVNYNQIDKMIENSYFDRADNLLENAINSNSKDIKARSLRVVSLAKQLKLDPAQEELNELLKISPKNADLHYAQGIVYYKRTTSSNMVHINNSQKLFEDAYKEFKTAVSLNPKDARYYNAAGVAALNLDKYDEAETLFKKAVQLDSKYSTAIDNLGTIDFAKGDLAAAAKRFNQALQYNTQNTTAMYHLAQVATQKQDYGKALIYLNNALAIDGNSASTYNLMGEVYQQQGNEPAAINAYRKSIMVKPEFPMPYFNLAGVYEKRGDGEFAIEQLKTALSVNPSFNDAKLKIADISLANGKFDQAITNYSALAKVKEYHDVALKGLASAYFEKAQIVSNKALVAANGNLFHAMDDLNKAIAANPVDLELHLAKLKLAKITNEPALSQEELNEIVQAPDGDLVNLVVKGEAYLALNNYDEAKKNFDLATDSAKNLDDQMYLAEIFLFHKQFDSAKTVLASIIESTKDGDPQNQQAVGDLDYIQKSEKYSDDSFKSAQYYVKSKDSKAAIDYLSRSLALNPNNANAHLLLAQIFEQQKNYSDAVANYKAYLGLTPEAPNKSKIEKKISHLEDKK